MRYGLSLRYGNETGVMMQSARERLSGTFKLSYNKQGKFFASNTLTVNRSTSQDPSYGSFSNFSKQNPYQSPYDAMVSCSQSLSTTWIIRSMRPLSGASTALGAWTS